MFSINIDMSQQTRTTTDIFELWRIAWLRQFICVLWLHYLNYLKYKCLRCWGILHQKKFFSIVRLFRPPENCSLPFVFLILKSKNLISSHLQWKSNMKRIEYETYTSEHTRSTEIGSKNHLLSVKIHVFSIWENM